MANSSFQEFELKNATELLHKLEDYFNVPRQNKEFTEKMFIELLSFLDAPAPHHAVYRYFLKREVIRELSLIFYYKFLSRHHSREENKKFYSMINAVKTNTKPQTRQYRVRELGVRGEYPNVEIFRGQSGYFIFDGIPVIVTNNSKKELDFINSEVLAVTREEVRVAASIVCTSPGFCLYFDGIYTQNVKEDLVENIPKDLTGLYLFSLCSILNRSVEANLFWGRASREDSSKYGFRAFSDVKKDAQLFMSKFSIRDNLLLRTASCLIKSTMLWRSGAFAEEAIASVFIALEGCLLIIQKRCGLTTRAIQREELKVIFKELFSDQAKTASEYTKTDQLLDFIYEVFERGGPRASLFHPAPDFHTDWYPWLSAEDFFEYYEIACNLLYFIVTGEKGDRLFGD